VSANGKKSRRSAFETRSGVGFAVSEPGEQQRRSDEALATPLVRVASEDPAGPVPHGVPLGAQYALGLPQGLALVEVILP